MTKFDFLKAHGLGNDFVILSDYARLEISNKLIEFICDRKIGIGCDLVVLLDETDNSYSDLKSKFFNKDGSEAEICGNALRCIGKNYFKKFNKTNLTVETNSGLIDIEERSDGNIGVDLGKPSLKWDKIPLNFETETSDLNFDLKYLKGGFAVNVGNPHLIFFVEELHKKELEIDSNKILKKNFFPNGINISAVQIVSKKKINILTFERGVGHTNACGSGAGASAFASFKSKYCDKKIEVNMIGGDLNIEITRDGHILTIGDAELVYEGKINLNGFIK